MEVLIAAAIVAAYWVGRWRERRRWVRQRDAAYRMLTDAHEARKASRHAFDVQMDVIRQQRQLLVDCVDAVDRFYAINDAETWRRLTDVAHRARTQTI